MKPPSIVTKTSSKLGVPAATLRCCPHGGARAGGRRAGRMSCRLGRPVTGHSRGSCTAARLAARPPVSEGFLGRGVPGWRPEASWARWDTGCPTVPGPRSHPRTGALVRGFPGVCVTVSGFSPCVLPSAFSLFLAIPHLHYLHIFSCSSSCFRV